MKKIKKEQVIEQLIKEAAKSTLDNMKYSGNGFDDCSDWIYDYLADYEELPELPKVSDIEIQIRDSKMFKDFIETYTKRAIEDLSEGIFAALESDIQYRKEEEEALEKARKEEKRWAKEEALEEKRWAKEEALEEKREKQQAAKKKATMKKLGLNPTQIEGLKELGISL